MIKYLTSKFSKVITLLVGVCLIGSAFHLHQLHPDYILQDQNIPQHISIDQPDCVACMNLMQALAIISEKGNRIRHHATEFPILTDQNIPSEFIFDVNNKSPPCQLLYLLPIKS